MSFPLAFTIKRWDGHTTCEQRDRLTSQVPLIATGTFGYPLLNIVSAAAKAIDTLVTFSVTLFNVCMESQNHYGVLLEASKTSLLKSWFGTNKSGVSPFHVAVNFLDSSTRYVTTINDVQIVLSQLRVVVQAATRRETKLTSVRIVVKGRDEHLVSTINITVCPSTAVAEVHVNDDQAHARCVYWLSTPWVISGTVTTSRQTCTQRLSVLKQKRDLLESTTLCHSIVQFDMEKTKIPLLSLQYPINRPLRQRRLYGLDGHHVGCRAHLYVFERGTVTAVSTDTWLSHFGRVVETTNHRISAVGSERPATSFTSFRVIQGTSNDLGVLQKRSPAWYDLCAGEGEVKSISLPVPASPDHLLDCWGISLWQLFVDQDLVCDILMRKCQMDLV
ncbi:hypothetical protein TNCV_1774941 [Trichonephila clavipes]|nr:hypothetical protein TNCV_1774941 [Trichonephila clavipes]